MSARNLTTLLAALTLAFAISACGGSDDEPAETAAPDNGAQLERPGQAAGGEGAAGKAGQAPDKAGGGGESADDAQRSATVDLRVRPASIKGARVTATGAVQTLPPNPEDHASAQENMYGSIREFGTEAEGAEATNISFALLQYLDAKARGDWATACARIYSVLRQNLEDPEKGTSCEQTYGALMSRSARSNRAEQMRIDVSSIRRGEGNRAFVIYKTPATLSADMPMYVEDGVWKVGALEAYALRPEQVG